MTVSTDNNENQGSQRIGAKRVHRLMRVGDSRLGDWKSLDAKWREPAAGGLVTHDLFHHEATDKGTYLQEMRAIGAEWYVDRQPLADSALPKVGARERREREILRRNALDATSNALDWSEKDPFSLPTPKAHSAADLKALEAAGLGPEDLRFFEDMAGSVATFLRHSKDPRTHADYIRQGLYGAFIEGYLRARARYPDQRRIRNSSLMLATSLEELSSDAVIPLGHVIELHEDGYDVSIHFEDADKHFRESETSLPAFFMEWYGGRDYEALLDISVHASVQDCAEFIEDRLLTDDHAHKPHSRLPLGEASQAMEVFVTCPAGIAELRAGKSIVIDIATWEQKSLSPRGVAVLEKTC